MKFFKNNHFCDVKRCLRLLILIVLNFNGIPFALSQKSTEAVRISGTMELDGVMNEPFWNTIQVADSFVVNYPNPGVVSPYRTTVRMAYDDQAVYIGAELHDVAPDSVLAILSQRDDFGNADWFGVLIDPYGAGQNGFGFFVTAAGVELDAILSQDDDDYTWNAVWKSRVVHTKTGWSLEIRIPLSQLRFPDQEVQNWKINFKRQVRRRREMSYWSPVDPTKYGEITQSGKVEGLTHLRSPLRLSFSPYTTAYVENYYNESADGGGSQEWRFRQRFGMDVKYGLSESFTLDATLIPDFGQTVSDRLVLNLSPFEIRYNENRPFFLEGMDLFGISDLFYTRRIGAPTLFGATRVDSLQQVGLDVHSAAGQAQLVNATKVSGRTKSGLGIGVFNAVEKRSVITYTDSSGIERELLAHPLTNYNVLVLSQNLKNNSNISFVNTNVLRPEVEQLSNVSALSGLWLTPGKKYTLSASGKLSVVQGAADKLIGHSFASVFEKVQGSFVYSLEYYETSDTFDPNDLGYLSRNNQRGVYAEAKWIGYRPKGHFLRRTLSFSTNTEYLYAPSKYAYWNIAGNAIGTFRNFLTCGLQTDVFPALEVDHFESRTFGRPVNFPQSAMVGGFYSSDYSKKYALDISLYNRFYNARGMNNLDVELSPRMRFSNKLFMVLSTALSRYLNNYGFVRVADTTYSGEIIIGKRNRWIVNNSISADYTFTNRMGLVLRLNHYWQEVHYLSFGELQNDGWTTLSNYTGADANGTSLHNTSYNAFTVDMNFRWVVYPGSEISFVWKYNIYASKNALDLNYFNVFNDLFEQPQLNSFSVKALFFLDAGKLKRRN
jgi:hypothetical protein